MPKNIQNLNPKRNCPTCNKEIIYTNSRSFNNADIENKSCQVCSRYGKPNERKIVGVKRNCPKCNKLIIHKSEISCYKSKITNKVCGSCRSSIQMTNPITRNRRIRSLKKIKHTSTWHNKIAKNRKENTPDIAKMDTL